MIYKILSNEYNDARSWGEPSGGGIYKHQNQFYARTVHYCVKGDTYNEVLMFATQNVECNSLGDLMDAIKFFNRRTILDTL
jgi:hypothetical protein